MLGEGRGPAWLGIGAQRSGTTWCTSLLLQHPQVELSHDGIKELHYLHSSLLGWGADERERYLALFDDDHRLRGEFTPAYLRSVWVPRAAREVCRPGAPVIVLLRDPVERFESNLRSSLGRKGAPSGDRVRSWTRQRGQQATLGGFYATQLDAWLEAFPRERFLVFQYEAVRQEPQACLDRIWGALGLDPVPLRHTDEFVGAEPAKRRATWRIDDVPGLRDRLRAMYAPEVDRIVAEWGFDRSLWPNF